ncbi:rCG58786 [Rattus norvegicus]|uniref:RCG58786 n=1 Tax=Rattus norvegicus TaxID=10116 RepID=A6JL66_RAT|nr:rCG58786 [Rattus norvegicus]
MRCRLRLGKQEKPMIGQGLHSFVALYAWELRC